MGSLVICPSPAPAETSIKENVNEYAFRYNHREDGEAMYSAAANRANKVRSGKHGGYSPIGTCYFPMSGKGV